MYIDHVSFSSSGGAGLVARALAETQAQLGHDSKLISFYSKNLHEQPFQHPLLTLAAYADEKLVKARSTKTMVSLFRNNMQLLDLESLREKAILNLHWNQGVISNSSVATLLRKNKPIVWTLHDMAPFTAACHHSHGCREYSLKCGSCPEVRPAFKALTAKGLQDKAVLEVPQKSLCIVTPSRWMAEAAQESVVFRNQRIVILQNPIHTRFFELHSKSVARDEMGISAQAFVGAALATRLDDPGKQVGLLLDLFFSTLHNFGIEAKFIIFGNGGDKLAARFPGVINLGKLPIEKIPSYLVAADFLGSLSIAESVGMTVREAGALGIPAIALANQGAAEQIEHLIDGILLETPFDITKAIEKVISKEIKLEVLGAHAKAKSVKESMPSVVANRYLDLYSELI